ncbi:hypothetical protein COO60DRAFT_1643956 [Scenedesmus sp. NREL 46B-D3]|nr:hypothetical protein COO60DRAFT_1643956 [Scenedesmus sp. NREL 46B-D3]
MATGMGVQVVQELLLCQQLLQHLAAHNKQLQVFLAAVLDDKSQLQVPAQHPPAAPAAAKVALPAAAGAGDQHPPQQQLPQSVAAANNWGGGAMRPPLPCPQQLVFHGSADEQEGFEQPRNQQQQQQQQQGDDDALRQQDLGQQLPASKQQLVQSPAGHMLAPAFARVSGIGPPPVVPPTAESLKQLGQQQTAAEQQQQDVLEPSQLTWSASFRSSQCGSDGASTYFYSMHTASDVGSSSARYVNIWDGLGQECVVPAGLLAATRWARAPWSDVTGTALE